jgi:ParB/RepB/Spo0J family partition protein
MANATSTATVNGSATSSSAPATPEFKVTPGAAPQEGKVLVLNVYNDIHYDPSWNARFSEEHNATPDADETLEGGATWDDFRRSLMAGQDTPVLVRPTPSGSNHKKPYELIAGFRRIKAIIQNAEELKRAPLVKAISRAMSDADARKLNLRENTARYSLGSPDLVYGIKALVAKEPDITSVALSADLGKNQSYISALMNIGRKLDANILKKWREMPDSSRLGYKDVLELAKMPKAEQAKAFEEMTSGEEDEGEGGDGDKNAWVKKACEKLSTIGNSIGRAVFSGHLQIVSDEFYLVNAGEFVKVKKNAKPGQLSRLAKAFEKGVAKGQEEAEALEAGEEEEDGGEEEEETPRAKRSAKK